MVVDGTGPGGGGAAQPWRRRPWSAARRELLARRPATSGLGMERRPPGCSLLWGRSMEAREYLGPIWASRARSGLQGWGAGVAVNLEWDGGALRRPGTCSRWSEGGGCILVRGGVEVSVFSVMRGVGVPRYVGFLARCCGSGGVNDKVSCLNPASRMGGVRLHGRKSCPSSVGAGGDGACGRRSPPWRRR